MVDKIEEQLTEKMWLSGNGPGDEDKNAFKSLGGTVPNVASHPNTFAWYALVSRFTWAQEMLSNSAPKSKEPAQEIDEEETTRR